MITRHGNPRPSLRRRMRLRTGIAVALLLCASCGGKAHQPFANVSATANSGACRAVRVPKEHRAVAQACPSERGSHEPIDMSACADHSGAKCTKDADCTAGQNGRCSLPHNEPCDTECTYDECLTDSDCAAGPCVCRMSGTDTLQNICLPGNCKTDSDCGSCGYCSLSATPVGHDCRVDYPMYSCHTAADECIDPSDCVDGGFSYCAFGASDAEHWACGTCLPFPVP